MILVNCLVLFLSIPRLKCSGRAVLSISKKKKFQIVYSRLGKIQLIEESAKILSDVIVSCSLDKLVYAFFFWGIEGNTFLFLINCFHAQIKRIRDFT